MEKEIKQQPPTRIEQTWFMQRNDNPNDVIAMSEEEAWHALQHRSNSKVRFKIVGVSDGKTYIETIKNSDIKKNELNNKISTLSMEITRYLNTKDKFKFEELLDDNDPKVIRVNEIINAKQKELDECNLQLQNIQKVVVGQAFQAELEKARGNIIMPKNFDVFTPDGNREKILRALGQ